MTDQAGLNAGELADLIVENRLKKNDRSYQILRNKCFQAISTMAANLKEETTVTLEQDDLNALVRVTEELREMDYKFRFIEVLDSSENIKEHRLLISIAHLLEG